MNNNYEIPLFDFVISVTEALDLVSPALVSHHKKVAYIALSLAVELGLDREEIRQIALGAALHDIGGISTMERLSSLEFETTDVHTHPEMGYRLIAPFTPFRSIAEIIRHHHSWWSEREHGDQPISRGSHIVHLADRVAVILPEPKDVLNKSAEIVKRMEQEVGKMFWPEAFQVFRGLSTKESFWLDAVSPSLSVILRRRTRLDALELDDSELLEFANIFRRLIDYRSRFTATHSSGVAATAEELARIIGFSPTECRAMRIAGYLHDLGKLAVGKEVLEKPGKLTREEFAIIRSHSYFTYKILEPISDLQMINVWGSYHHERIDGTGYPFHLSGDKLCLGSRIMAVADVFTAITEDRPYRAGMTKEKTLDVLDAMGGPSLDRDLVQLLTRNYDQIAEVRVAAQSTTQDEYLQIIRSAS